MKRIFSKGSLCAILLNILVYRYFPNIFGETPLNLLGIGGSNGNANLMFNLFTYSLLTLVITIILSFVASDKRAWFLSNLIGVSIASLGLYFYTMSYLLLFWGKNGLQPYTG